MQLPDGIPRLAIIAVVILALIGAVWFWKRWKSSSQPDKELTENDKAQRHAAVYADNVAKSLQEYEDDTDAEDADEEQTGAVTTEYTQEVQRGLEDSEDDMEDDEEYEPMD